jgi:hypothetical protein
MDAACGLRMPMDMDELPGAPTARLEATRDGASRLHLGGRLPPDWAGRLALGLSREQVTILRGYACRASRGGWSAYFDLRGLDGALALQSIDFCALATLGEPGAVPVAIDLERYTLVPMIGGGLQLWVYGRDRLGFLGSLLERFAGLSLFPEEMHVETHGRVAADRFHIRAAGGRPVSDEARRALDALLGFWLRASTPWRLS